MASSTPSPMPTTDSLMNTEYKESREEKISGLRYQLNKKFNKLQKAKEKYSKFNCDKYLREKQVAEQEHTRLKEQLNDLKKEHEFET